MSRSGARTRSAQYVSKWGGGKGVVPKASGGDITYAYSQGKLQAVHTFNDTGTFTPLEAMEVEYLVIAGGGGGCQGGGGSGGYRSSVVSENTCLLYTSPSPRDS